MRATQGQLAKRRLRAYRSAIKRPECQCLPPSGHGTDGHGRHLSLSTEGGEGGHGANQSLCQRRMGTSCMISIWAMPADLVLLMYRRPAWPPDRASARAWMSTKLLWGPPEVCELRRVRHFPWGGPR